MNKQILEAKQSIVKEIVDKSKSSQSVLVCEYRGLSVSQLTEIRRALHKDGADMLVFKNSLFERASDELGIAELKDILKGPNAFVFSNEVSNGPKIIAKYAKRYKDFMKIKGGIVEGKFADADLMKEVSALPSREGLISMFLSCLQAPVRSFACAVKAVADK